MADFHVENVFNPGAILSGMNAVKLPDVAAMRAKDAQVKAQENENSLFPQRKQVLQNELDTQRDAATERALGMQERQDWMDIMQKHGGDYAKARPELAGKMRPGTLMSIDKTYADHQKTLVEILKQQGDLAKTSSELKEKERQAFGGIAADIAAAKYNPAAAEATLSMLELTHPEYKAHIDQVRAQWAKNPDSIQQTVDSMITPEARAAAQELLNKKASQTQTETQTRETEAKIPGEKAKSDMEVAQAAMLKGMTDADWQTNIDNVVEDKASPLYKRTVSEVNFLRRKGDFKGAADVIKRAGEQLGKVEAAVATAKATVPYKIEVNSAVGNAAGNAAEKSGAIDIMAEQALAGQFQSRNPQLLSRVYGRAAEMAKERGLTSRQVVMEQNAAKASRDAYSSLVKNYETLKPFAEMAERNASILEEKAAKVSNLGGSFFNLPLREAQAKFTGNTDVAAFVAAMQPVIADFSRLLNSPTGAGVLSDDARHEMQKAIKPGATLGEIKAALDVFRTDARNRKEEYERAIGSLKERTVSPESSPAAPAAGGASKISTQAQYDALPSGASYINAKDGQTYRKP